MIRYRCAEKKDVCLHVWGNSAVAIPTFWEEKDVRGEKAKGPRAITYG